MKRFLVLLLMALCLAGCGRRGPLIPPEALAPAAIQTLRVEQKGDAFFVAWSAPGRDVVARKIGPPPRYRLYRREVLPPGQDCEECKGAYILLREVDEAAPGDVRRIAGGFVFVDAGVETGKLYQYVVTSVSPEGAESSWSNKARRKKVEPPPAVKVAATSVPPGVVLEWEAPPETPKATLGAYQVYRQLAEKPETLTLVYQAGASERRYEDLRVNPGASYIYYIRGVFTVEGELLEGRLSNPAEVTPTVPPAVGTP